MCTAAGDDLMHLGFIPIVITGMGDGLAEPVGINFGGRWGWKYEARACCTNKSYNRSVEGSCTVAAAGYLVLICLFNKFSLYEWILNMLIVPPAMTWVEAYSPHALDNPLLYFVGSLIPTLIHYIPGITQNKFGY